MQGDTHKQLLELEARLKIHRLHESMLVSRIAELRKRFQEECPHEHTEEERSYFEGSYYDTAYTDVEVVCTACEKVVDRWRNSTGHYG